MHNMNKAQFWALLPFMTGEPNQNLSLPHTHANIDTHTYTPLNLRGLASQTGHEGQKEKKDDDDRERQTWEIIQLSFMMTSHRLIITLQYMRVILAVGVV